MKPKISVIVPSYNTEFYLDRCLASLENQEIRDPFEVLLVNDGSTDDSPVVMEEHVSARPDLFHTYHKPNGGHGSACNLGIEKAQGDYIALVDADDFLSPDHLQDMLHEAESSGADLVMGDQRYHFDDRVETEYALPRKLRDKSLSSADRAFLYKTHFSPNAKLYKRSLFADPEVRFLEGVIYADAGFVPKAYYAARHIRYVSRPWYHYDLTRPDQTMKMTDLRILDIVAVLRDLLEFYKRKNAFDSYHHELEFLTIHHVLNWVPKVEHLPVPSRGPALAKLFAILDEYFPTWKEDPAFFEAAQPQARRLWTRPLMVKFNQKTDQRPYLWAMQLKDSLKQCVRFSRQQIKRTTAVYYRLPPGARDRIRRVFKKASP